MLRLDEIGFWYIGAMLIIGAAYLVASIYFLSSERRRLGLSAASRGYRLVSVDPIETFSALKTIWISKSNLRRAPLAIGALWASRAYLAVYLLMFLYFAYDVVLAPA